MALSFAAQQSNHKIAIVGGGILGMALAKRLQSEGFQVEILEGSTRTGGLASPAEIGDFTWDRFYHVILLSDLKLRNLLDELGLSSELRWGNTKTGFFTDGTLYSLSNALEFLNFPALSLLGKFRLGATIFCGSRMRNWRKLEGYLASDWLTRWSGEAVYKRIWLPLLRSKLGDNYKIASAAFIWAIIQRLYAARQSGLKREMFGYVEGGYGVILEQLQELLDRKGVVTRTASCVSQVSRVSGTVTVDFEEGGSRDYDSVVLTVPAPAVANLCPQISEQERRRLLGITYQGIVCASFLLRKPLSDFYVTNITDDWLPFTGVIEMTALVDRRSFAGCSLVYLPRYLAQDDPFWERTDDEVCDEFVSALERMYPEFSPDDVLDFQVSRARQVLAVSTLEYSKQLMPPTETSIPGVYIVNSAQIAHGTLNVNETLGVVKDRLPELLSSIRNLQSRPNTNNG